MFTKWFALDAGAYTTRMYDIQGQQWKECRSCYGVKEGNIEQIGIEALSYVHKDHHHQVKYILDAGKIKQSPYALLERMLSQMLISNHLFRPGFIVSIPMDTSASVKKEWQNVLSELGARQVRFASSLDILDQDDYSFLIHVGHSLCEIGLYIHGEEQFHHTIPIAGKKMDEAIQERVGRMHNCLISLEDANAIKHAISDVLWQNKNGTIQCWGMNRYQKYEELSLKALDFWPCMEEVENQIAESVKESFRQMGMLNRQKVSQNHVHLTGGMAHCFGLRQILEKELYCPIICTQEPSYDIISSMKEW